MSFGIMKYFSQNSLFIIEGTKITKYYKINIRIFQYFKIFFES